MHATSVFSSTPLASGSSCWGGLHGLGIPNAQTNTVSATNMCWFEDKVQVEKLTQLVWLKCLYMIVICQMGKLQNEWQSSTRTRTYPNPKCIGFFLGGYLKKSTETRQNNPIFPGHPCNSTAKLCEIFTMQNVPPKVPNFVPSEWAQHLGTRVARLRIDHAEIYRFLEMRVRLQNVYHHYHHQMFIGMFQSANSWLI